MKQRLLLALLMLLTSAGFMKAQITITPSGTEKVTITLTSSAAKFVSPSSDPSGVGSYPVITGQTPQVTASSVVYAIDKPTGVLSIATDYNEAWGDMTITVDGKVSKFVTEGEVGLQNHVTRLVFTNNGELANLTLGSNAGNMKYFTKLATLSCSGNKLKRIPQMGESMTAAGYQIGEQTPAVSFTGLTGNARTGVELSDPSTVFAGWTSAPTDMTGMSFAELKEGDKVVTAYAIKDDTNPNRYFFKDGSIYMHGDYIAKIKLESETTPGVIICGIPVKVSAAQFKLTVKTNGKGKVTADPADGTTTLVKGQPVDLTPVPEDGYTFTDFTDIKGLTKSGVDGNKYSYTVTGDEDPTITANFKAGSSSIEITQPANGTIKVLDESGKEVTNPAVGSTVEIRVNANYGYEVDKVYNGNTSLEDQDKENRSDFFTCKMIVPAEGLKLSAVMSIKKSDLTIVYKGTITGTTVIAGGQKLSHVNHVYEDIAWNTSLKISFTVANSTDDVKVVCGSQEYPLRKELTSTEAVYHLDDFTMPIEDTRMVVTVTSMNAIDVVVADTDIKMTYDGTPKAIKYTTVPNNLEGFKVEYSADKGTSYTETPFTAAGSYIVRFTREADATHAAFTKEIEYEITPAQVVITEEPKVEVVKENGSDTYKLSGGKAAYLRGDQYIDITAQGEFKVDETVNGGGKYVRVFFNLKEENKNFKPVEGTDKEAQLDILLKGEDTKEYTVKVDPSSADILTMMNGSSLIKNGSTVLEGTKIDFKIKEDPSLTGKYSVYQIDANGNKLPANGPTNFYTTGFTFGKDGDSNATTVIFKVEVNDGRKEIILGDASDSAEERTQEVKYDGSVKNYNWKTLSLTTKDKDDVEGGNWTITYTKGGKTVAEPTDAGTYDVTLNREATENFQAFSTTATLVINKAKLTAAQVPAPTASRINVGMTLGDSYLTGSADVAGHYEWDKDLNTVVMESSAYSVKFYASNGNYEPYTLEQTVTVPVTNEAIIVLRQYDYNGYVTVEDVDGHSYHYGDVIPEGTKLIIKAIPNDPDVYEVASLTVDGSPFTNGGTYEFGKKSIVISATFQVKTKPGNFKVTVPEYLRGTIITGGGEHVVAEGGTLSFTVATASADASKVSVKASNGTVTKGSNGRYTLSGLTANSTVTVSLSNPTALKVDIQKSYLNAGKYHVATVEVESDYTDGKFYYGDEITVVAYPESGVKFEKWSDGSKDQVHDIVLTGDLKLTATFSGTPTGIEDIMAASIATGKGCVWVRGIANADVTIVSIAGRVQARQRISGDTRIDVPAGIYVVVLESGSDVKRVKVIVK